jgi:Tfp pilus assembly protein PilF
MSTKHTFLTRGLIALDTSLALAIMTGALALGCNGNKPAVDPVTNNVIKTTDGKVINVEAAQKFEKSAALLNQHDVAGDWTDSTCEEAASAFKDASSKLTGGEFFEALYNAGVSYRRCKNDAKAKEIFEEILKKNSKFHRARVQVALYEFNAGGQKDVDKAIAEMTQAISDAEFKNEEALVFLAMLQMMRDNDVSDDDGKNDFERAKGNLQRALAINDSFMPAFNQLAVYYLESAKKKAQAAAQKDKKASSPTRRRAGVKAAVEEEKKADTQALELAQLVCSQAIRKNPKYAPVYNTMGLISAELGDLSQAASSFGQARGLDPKFFEAHMNYAAVNLQFRGFDEAAKAYKAAIDLKPNDYEAHLGMALAARGQIKDDNWDQKLAETQKELDEAKKIDANRPETYYNEAILVEEFKTKMLEGEKAEPVFNQAKSLFQQFIEKAKGKDEYAVAVKRAEERIKDIDVNIQVIKENAAAAKNPPPAAPPPAAPRAGDPAAPPPADPPKDAPPPKP